MSAGQQWVVGLVMVGLFGLFVWLILAGGTGSMEWAAPVRVRVVAEWPIAEWEAGIAAYESRQSIYEQWMRRRAGELIVPAHVAYEWARPVFEEIRRAQVHEAWMRRRAAEAPWFAQLAEQMGLGLALGVAA